MSTPTATTSLETLVDDLDHAVRTTAPGRPRLDAVVDALAAHIHRPDLVPPDLRFGDPAGYRTQLLHVAPGGAFSLVAMMWLPGQTTPVHDHLSWCAVGVYTGEEHETRYRHDGGRLVVDGTTVAGPGEVTGLLPPGDIHRVTNTSTGLAISLHVYGVDISQLGSSIHRRHDRDLPPTAVAGSARSASN